jgi:hypothetical protein
LALAEELNISKEVQTKRSVRRINLVTYEAGCMATDRLLKLIERRAKMLPNVLSRKRMYYGATF